MTSKVDIQYVQFYTDGSAAKKVVHPLPKKRMEKKAAPRRARRKVIRIDPVALLSLAVCLALAITLGMGVGKLQQARLENQRMAAYVEKLSVESETLAKAFAEGCDLNEIEKTAMALGYVYSDQASHRGVAIQLETEEPSVPQLSFWQNLMAYFANIFA